MLTDAEIKLIEMLADCADAFCRLSVQHPSDQPEFLLHIHALQEKTMSRSAVRAHPELFGLSAK